MDISHYTGQTLLAPRKTAIDPVAAVARKSQPEQETSNEASDPGSLFETVVDSINPLQHIPGVSAVYQETTGDTQNPLAAMAGGFLFGGPMGLVAGAAGSFLEMLTGKSLAGHAMALFSGGDEATPETANGIQSAAVVGDGSPLMAPEPGISLAQYQSFAKAATGLQQGIGAKATNVAWSENLWTQQSLKEATGLYETNQRLGNDDAHSQRSA